MILVWTVFAVWVAYLMMCNYRQRQFFHVGYRLVTASFFVHYLIYLFCVFCVFGVVFKPSYKTEVPHFILTCLLILAPIFVTPGSTLMMHLNPKEFEWFEGDFRQKSNGSAVTHVSKHIIISNNIIGEATVCQNGFAPIQTVKMMFTISLDNTDHITTQLIYTLPRNHPPIFPPIGQHPVSITSGSGDYGLLVGRASASIEIQKNDVYNLSIYVY